jgi:acyl-CoA thioesterase-1
VRRGAASILVFVVVAWTACSDRGGDPGSAPPAAAPATSVASAPSPANPLLVVLGDSIAAGYGLAQEDAFPALIAAELEVRGRPVRVVNAGVSGDTTAGGLARLDWLLRQRPDVLLVELGGNDGLRGLPLAATEENLRRIVAAARGAGAEVILAGMRLPPNLGPEYTAAFAAIYPRLAADYEVALIPFLLEGVGGVPLLNLPDGIHPTPEGHRRIARLVTPYVERALRS